MCCLYPVSESRPVQDAHRERKGACALATQLKKTTSNREKGGWGRVVNRTNFLIAKRFDYKNYTDSLNTSTTCTLT